MQKLITNYTFNAAARTITFLDYTSIQIERVILIVNVTRNTNIYIPASDNSSIVSGAANILTLSYNTTAMSNTDRLQIFYDDAANDNGAIGAIASITTSANNVLQDPVNKLRVSQPQSLIDTDFEYGTQPTKWESLAMDSNRPCSFFDVTTPLAITAISGAGTRVVTVATTTPPPVGTTIYIQDAVSSQANGWYLVDSVVVGISFTYTAKGNVSGSIFDTTKSFIFIGNFYSSSFIPVSAAAGATFTNAGTVVTSTTNAHGLGAGDGVYVIGTTATTNTPNGAWVVASTPTSNTFTFNVVNAPTGAITASAGATNTLFARALGFSSHRSFDGGVTFSTGTPTRTNSFIRQTRKYFRYQSGKGLQFSTGTILAPTFQLDNIASVGATVTVTTKFNHNLGIGARVIVAGCNETAYNGTFTVTAIIADNIFTYTALSAPSATPATGSVNSSTDGVSGGISVGLRSWNGAFVNLGIFDSQNGLFFQTDGQRMFVVRRKSTDQLSGSVAVTNGTNTVTGTNTKFATELAPNDMIVIRGKSYLVVSIASNTQLFISPEYRGVTVPGNCIISKTVDTRISQAFWNIDKCDGTGASRFNLDITKMQMFYIDYTWYGAGTVRFGFRGLDGNVFYCHSIVNANVNQEAYMRSGNLPARYEATNAGYATTLASTLSNATTTGGTISLTNASQFPNTGQIVITQAGNTGQAIEVITYTAKTGNNLVVGSRAVLGGNTVAQTFTFSATAPIAVQLASVEASPILSHWGSSMIMDGRFDNDKQIAFTAGMRNALTNIPTSTNTNSALLGIRLAPSVDSGLTGALGARDLINRMQLTFTTGGAAVSAGATTPVTFLIQFILNGRLSTATGNNWIPAGGSSLSQALFCASGTTVIGGEAIYSLYISASPNSVSDGRFDLSEVRDLASSILGGGNNLLGNTGASNIYPDGPDTVYLTATNVSAQNVNSINARISWTEAQA